MDEQLARWLAAINRPEIENPKKHREQALAEIHAAGSDAVFCSLVQHLQNSDFEVRCETITALALIDGPRAVEHLITMLADPEEVVRWHAAGCLHDFGDQRAVPALAELLRSESSPSVRGTAAYALGGIGSPAAIPNLLAALESDHEVDELGYSPSSCAATALDNILGTHETRIQHGKGLCQMAPGPPDLERLRLLAEELFQKWSADGRV